MSEEVSMNEVVVYEEHAVALKNRRGNKQERPERSELPHAQLQSYVNRLTTLHVEKKEAADAIKEVASKAESAGFSKKALLALVKRNMETAEQRAERLATEEEVDRMAVALGMLSDTPLGSAAMRSAEAG